MDNRLQSPEGDSVHCNGGSRGVANAALGPRVAIPRRGFSALQQSQEAELKVVLKDLRLQSPEGDSVHCNEEESLRSKLEAVLRLQSPEGDSVHCNGPAPGVDITDGLVPSGCNPPKGIQCIATRKSQTGAGVPAGGRLQSPEGDSVHCNRPRTFGLRI